MAHQRTGTGDVSPDEIPTLGEGPSRGVVPGDTPSMLRRDRLLNPHRQPEETEEPEDENRLVKLLLIGVVLFVFIDVVIVAYKFGWLGGNPAPAPPQPTVEAPADKAKGKPAVIEGVKVKEGMSEGLGGAPPPPAPAQRPIDPPEM